MLAFRLDKWVRVAAGLGMLLLLLAQEKVCPWLLRRPHCAESQPAALPRAANETDAPEQRRKPVLSHVLPDAPVPRWPASWNQVTLRQTTGARDGVVSCGEENPRRDASTRAAEDAPAWRCFLQPRRPVDSAPPAATYRVMADPAVRTSITPTGPPLS